MEFNTNKKDSKLPKTNKEITVPSNEGSWAIPSNK